MSHILGIPPWSTRIENYEIGIHRIPVGSAPTRDRNRSENRQQLALLPATFAAYVRDIQHKDEDGHLAWEQPIVCEIMAAPHIRYWLEPCTAPLEIGSLRAEQLALRIGQAGTCAWWQYGHTDIWLLHELIPAIQANIEHPFHEERTIEYSGVT
jgi:hypothetical protein